MKITGSYDRFVMTAKIANAIRRARQTLWRVAERFLARSSARFGYVVIRDREMRAIEDGRRRLQRRSGCMDVFGTDRAERVGLQGVT